MLFIAQAHLLLWVALLGMQAGQLDCFQSCENFYSLSLACPDLSGLLRDPLPPEPQAQVPLV